MRPNLSTLLHRVYPAEQAAAVLRGIADLQRKYAEAPSRPLSLSEHDVLLITYGDQVQHAGEPPLRTLHRFL
ncbi:MAG: alpha-amylase, partial [Bacteroidota bacterium]